MKYLKLSQPLSLNGDCMSNFLPPPVSIKKLGVDLFVALVLCSKTSHQDASWCFVFDKDYFLWVKN